MWLRLYQTMVWANLGIYFYVYDTNSYIRWDLCELWNGAQFSTDILTLTPVKKVGQGSAKRYAHSCSVVKVIDEQGEAIGRFHKTIVNSSKYISNMSTTMGGMAQDLQSYVTEMNYYATGLHQVDKRVEESFILLCFRLCYRKKLSPE